MLIDITIKQQTGIYVLHTLLCVNFFIYPEITKYTQAHNKAVYTQLNFNNKQDFSDTKRGFIAPLPHNGIIKNKSGKIVWDLSRYNFLKKEKSPETVNPSLWRQAQLLSKAGLFKVADRIYQVRGADISNMTIIESKTGLIIIDTLLCIETAHAALDLYYQHRPQKPIKAVIYTHSHIDHFGGVKGIISQADVDAGKMRVIAPIGFTRASFDENLLAGNAMARRATYMYGNLLPANSQGQVSCGLGLITSSGENSFIAPTEFIEKTGQTKEIDGLQFIFINAPGSEAPAEMIFFIPELQALAIAEDANHTMHNLYTLRGAKVRDARAWAQYLNTALELFGPDISVIFGQHQWPVWGNQHSIIYLEKQRDLYKFIHDQTLRLANQGYTSVEIAERIKLPQSLSTEWYNQGYYGSLNHNSKAVYDFYLGWFDGNPSHLHILPETQASKKYIEYMGGSQKILAKAKRDYQAGHYRWVAQVINHVVFAEPQNINAKKLLADTLEQLGYQTDNGTWRNFYLTGAQELRLGVKKLPVPNPNSPDVINNMPITYLFDYLAIHLNGLRAAENPLQIQFILTDTHEKYLVQIKNGVLNYYKKYALKPDCALELTRTDLNALFLKTKTLAKLISEQKIKILGNKKIFKKFLTLFDKFNFWFNIIEPQP